jgi:hypothetical protein
MKIHALLLSLIFPIGVAAGISAPNSHATLSRDGTRLLVMISTDAKWDRAAPVTLPDGRVIVSLGDAFPKSGAYDARTLAPLWQVDWFSFERDIRCSDDFRSVVRSNRQGMRSNWALAFYRDGSLIRTYACAELLTGLRQCLPYETWDWHTRWYEDFDLNSDGKRIVLSTARRRTFLCDRSIDLGLQEFYTFDLASGAVVTRRTAGAWLVWAYGAAGLAILGTVALALRFVVRSITASRRRRGFPLA